MLKGETNWFVQHHFLFFLVMKRPRYIGNLEDKNFNFAYTSLLYSITPTTTGTVLEITTLSGALSYF